MKFYLELMYPNLNTKTYIKSNTNDFILVLVYKDNTSVYPHPPEACNQVNSSLKMKDMLETIATFSDWLLSVAPLALHSANQPITDISTLPDASNYSLFHLAQLG